MTIEKKLIGPLLLSPIHSERIWGVTSLEPWLDASKLEKPVGEAWLTSVECPITGGSLHGETLGEAAAHLPQLLGDPEVGGFPLLIKILFPREKLSVQVHPNDAQARAAGLPNGQGKTECWYVLSAEPGATIALGFRETLTPEQVREAVADQTLEDKLAHVPVKAGDMVFVEAGTVHAIGPGVVILETQQYSDVTYRMFDYGRPRELHLDQGLAVMRMTTGSGVVKPAEVGQHTELVRSKYFVVDRFDMLAERSVELECADELQILIALAEGCTLVSQDGDSMVLPKAHAVVLPGEGIRYSVIGGHEAELIRVRR